MTFSNFGDPARRRPCFVARDDATVENFIKKTYVFIVEIMVYANLQLKNLSGLTCEILERTHMFLGWKNKRHISDMGCMSVWLPTSKEKILGVPTIAGGVPDDRDVTFCICLY